MQHRYTSDWSKIATSIKTQKQWQCEKCYTTHQNIPGKRIQVHHRNYDPADNRTANLQVLCPPCHLAYHINKRGSISPGQLSLTI